MSELHTPVLFIVFNRPDPTAQVFEAIRQARPPRLYIAADGPRLDRLGEAAQVQAVRDYVVSHVDWDCVVKTRFQPTNLGCRLAVSSAIDWFFEHEPEGIILEDDCLPDASFFPYTQELLGRYRDDQRVMGISGIHLHGDEHQPPHSYFFSHYNHVWGWASWRRAWQHYDREMDHWPALRNTEWLLTVGHGNRQFQRHWNRIFDRTADGLIDTWDYQWTFSAWSQGGLSILPARNLIRNIGFGAGATHTTDSGEGVSDLPLESLDFPLSHPSVVMSDYAADRWTYENHSKIRLVDRVKGKLKKMLVPANSAIARG
jgi:hypothetical protein